MLLDRPVALAGFLGARVPLTGAMLATGTGLPLVDLDRVVEHEAGRSLRRVPLELGAGAMAELEGRVLARVLQERPPPIIALGYDTLNDAGNRALLLRQAQLIYIRRGLEEMLAGMEQDTAAARRPRPVDRAGLEALLAQCVDGYAAAPEVLDASGRHPNRVAQALLSRLQG